jgi:hypothetical protein
VLSPALALMMLAAAAPLSEDPDFIQAQALYADLEFEAAVTSLKVAATRPYSRRERAQLELWMGLCSAQLRDELGAKGHFAQAVALDVEVASPGFAPPKVVELLEGARAEQRARLAADKPPDLPPDDTPTTDAPIEEATAPSTEPTERAVVDEPSVIPWVAAGACSVGAAAFVAAAAAMGGVGAFYAVQSRDPNQFQSDAAGYAATATALYAGAAGAAVLVVVASTGAASSVVWALVE